VHKNVVLPAVSLRRTVYPEKWRWRWLLEGGGRCGIRMLSALHIKNAAGALLRLDCGARGSRSDNPQLFYVNWVFFVDATMSPRILNLDEGLGPS